MPKGRVLWGRGLYQNLQQKISPACVLALEECQEWAGFARAAALHSSQAVLKPGPAERLADCCTQASLFLCLWILLLFIAWGHWKGVKSLIFNTKTPFFFFFFHVARQPILELITGGKNHWFAILGIHSLCSQNCRSISAQAFLANQQRDLAGKLQLERCHLGKKASQKGGWEWNITGLVPVIVLNGFYVLALIMTSNSKLLCSVVVSKIALC